MRESRRGRIRGYGSHYLIDLSRHKGSILYGDHIEGVGMYINSKKIIEAYES